MNKKQIIKLLTGIFFTTAITANAAEQEDFAKGRILVMPKAGLTNVEFNKILKENNGKARKVGQSNFHIVNVPNNSEKAIVEKLKRNPHVKFAELDKRVKIDAISNDPYLGSEYHISKIGATTAWDIAQGEGVTIAILDSGVDPTHPDLASSLVPGYNFYDNNTNTVDVCGHGTPVAGSAAAITNNGVGVAGVAGKAKIMPIRIAYKDATTGNCYGYYSTMTSGLIFAADNGARVANISYSNVADSQSVLNAAQYLRSKNGLVVISAGNTGGVSASIPTNLLTVVSATDSNDVKTSWSTYGDFVTLSAPGASIYTTSNGGSYGSWSGTSFASPITAGVAALVMSANPLLYNSDVEEVLHKTSVDLGSAGRDSYYGYGRVNAAQAVSLALRISPSVDTIAPSVYIGSPRNYSNVSGLVPVSVMATDNYKVTNVELFINGNTVAIDSIEPFEFSWDSKSVANGIANVYAIAYDQAGNKTQSDTIALNVANDVVPIIKDTTAPKVTVVNPTAGSVTGTVNIVTNATDDSEASGITQTIYIDGKLIKTGTGSSLAYKWNTRKAKG